MSRSCVQLKWECLDRLQIIGDDNLSEHEFIQEDFFWGGANIQEELVLASILSKAQKFI